MAAKKGRSVTKEEGRNVKQKPRLVPNCTRDLRAMFALPFLSLCGERRNPPLPAAAAENCVEPHIRPATADPVARVVRGLVLSIHSHAHEACCGLPAGCFLIN